MSTVTPGSSQGIDMVRITQLNYVCNIVVRNQFRWNHSGRMGSSDMTGFNNSQINVEGNDWYLDKVNALFEEDSDKLSSVGRIYNNH